MLMMDSDRTEREWRSLTETIKSRGVPLILQLVHCGRATSRRFTGSPVVAPSPISDGMWRGEKPLALTEDGIREIATQFSEAADRACRWGFDGIQLHAAHGFLLSQFLSGYSNRRKDSWGGSLENRFRITGEIIRQIKDRHPDFPVLVKLHGYDGRPHGTRIPEAAETAVLMEQAGADALEISCGYPEDNDLTARRPHLPVEAALRYHHNFKKVPGILKPLAGALLPRIIKPARPELAYNIPAARAVRKKIAITVITTGGLHRRETIERVIADGDTDMVSLSRPLIREPDLVRQFRTGRSDGAKCIRCNYCTIMIEEGPLRCWYGKLPPV